MADCSSNKLAKAIHKSLNNNEVDELLVTYFMDIECNTFAHRRFYNLMVSYIYRQAHKYEVGLIPSDLYDLVVMCKRIKDEVLEPVAPPPINPVYTEKPVVAKEYISPIML